MLEDIDIDDLDPVAFRNKLLISCHQPNLPNATYVPTPQMSLPYSMTPMPLGTQPERAQVTVKISKNPEKATASPRQVYSEKGVFERSVALRSLSLPMGVEIGNLLRAHSLAAFEGVDATDWSVSMLARLGVPDEVARKLLEHAPMIRPGVTRPYLRPDHARDRVVFGRHHASHRVEVAISNLHPHDSSVALSYEEIKVYAASLGLNLAIDAPMLARQPVEADLVYCMKLAISPDASAPMTSCGAYFELPPVDEGMTRALDFAQLDDEMANIRSLTDSSNQRVEALVTRMRLVTQASEQRIPHTHTIAGRTRVAGEEAKRDRSLRAAVVVAEKPARNFVLTLKTAIAVLAVRDKRVRVLLTAARMAPREAWKNLFLSDKSTTSRLTKALAKAVTKTDIWANESSRWPYVLSLLYGGAAVFLSSQELEDHMLAAMIDDRGPRMITRLIREASSDIEEVKVDAGRLQLLGFLLAGEGGDLVAARDYVASSIMEKFQKRYQSRRAALAKMVKESAMNGLLHGVSKDMAQNILKNAKAHLVELQWLAKTFHVDNLNFLTGEIQLTRALSDVVLEMAKAFARKRVTRSNHYRGKGTAHGEELGEVMMHAISIVREHKNYAELAEVLDKYLGTNFGTLGRLLVTKLQQTWQDVRSLTKGYERAIAAAKEGPEAYSELALEVVDGSSDMLDLTNAKAMFSLGGNTQGLDIILNDTDMNRIEMRDTFQPQHIPGPFDDMTEEESEEAAWQAMLAQMMANDPAYAGGEDLFLDVTEADRKVIMDDWAEAEAIPATALREAIYELEGHVSPEGVVIQPSMVGADWMQRVVAHARFIYGQGEASQARAAADRATNKRDKTFTLS